MSASLTQAPGGSTPPPGAAPPTGGAGAPTPPIGSSSATGPTQNLGATAQGNQIVAMLLKGLVMAMTKVPPGTKLYAALAKANQELGREIEPGATSPAGESNAMKAMALQQMRMRPQAAAQATQGKPPAPPGAAPAPPAPGPA